MTLSSIPQLANIVLPAFLVIAMGFFFRRAKKIDISSINDLVVYVTTPCLIISSLSDFTMDPSVTAKLFLSISAVIFSTIIIGGALTKALQIDSRVYLPPLVFANTGNLGLPLCLFAFGQYGFNIAILCVVATMLLHYTVGIMILGSAKGLREILTLPLIYATVAGIVINSVGFQVPVVIERPVALLGEITIPAMLFALGYKLSEMKLSRLWLSCFFGSARIFLGVILGAIFVNVFGLKGVEAKVVILECSMPPAVFNFVLAEKYGRDSETVASIIVAGTGISLLVLPFVISYLVNQ
ncbi:MAG: AEC family transporter [Candidatus Dadabacteria bacterium]|nr:AEC family transporter [Candidatus Dadabacteria bacterium]MCY4261829.1 AEC family transporter [Candidatus Dadabacteria bacterium]